MWAYRLQAPSRLVAVDVAAPDPTSLDAGRVLLRTLAGGICGSDVPRFRGLARVPGSGGAWGPVPVGMPMHEIVGEVLASRHPEVAVGDRVVGWADRTDGLAEQVETDGEQVVAYAPGLAPADAVLIQSLACVLHALDRVPVAGRSVAVLGLGPIGLLFAWVLRRRGAAEVMGIDPVDRTASAATFGLDEVVVTDSGSWAAAVAGTGPDVIVEAVGHQTATVAHAVRAVADEGTVYCFGIPLADAYPVDVHAVVRRNLRIVGGITKNRREVLGRAIAHLAEAPSVAEELVTHVVAAGEAGRAFDAACAPRPGQLKVVLEVAL